MKAVASFTSLATIALCVTGASAKTLFEYQTEFDLSLIRGAEVSKQCNLITDETRARAISNIRMKMAQHQAAAHIYDFDTAAKIDTALAEGKTMSTPELCRWYERHPDNAADKVSIIEGLAYGPAGKPK